MELKIDNGLLLLAQLKLKKVSRESFIIINFRSIRRYGMACSISVKVKIEGKN